MKVPADPCAISVQPRGGQQVLPGPGNCCSQGSQSDVTQRAVFVFQSGQGQKVKKETRHTEAEVATWSCSFPVPSRGLRSFQPNVDRIIVSSFLSFANVRIRSGKNADNFSSFGYLCCCRRQHRGAAVMLRYQPFGS